jgi:hypothetical protein
MDMFNDELVRTTAADDFVQFAQVNCHRVPVNPVKATLRYNAPGIQNDILVGWNLGHAGVQFPRLDQLFAKLSARLHQECARPDGNITNFKSQNHLWCRFFPKPRENRLQGFANNGLRK